MFNQFKHRTTKSDIAKDKTRFVCTVPRCGKTYSRNQRLKIHIIQKHMHNLRSDLAIELPNNFEPFPIDLPRSSYTTGF